MAWPRLLLVNNFLKGARQHLTTREPFASTALDFKWSLPVLIGMATPRPWRVMPMPLMESWVFSVAAPAP